MLLTHLPRLRSLRRYCREQIEARRRAAVIGAYTETNCAFDGKRAFSHVKNLVNIGPRPAGSAKLALARRYITNELQSYGLKIVNDEFIAQTPSGAVTMVNITAEIPGTSSDCIIIASHYETKVFKEFEFVGANDGGSSTGALLELARTLPTRRKVLPFTYQLVFFDGEEAFCRDWDDCGTQDAPDNTYGSRHHVAQLIAQKRLKNVRAMVLLDMIGYRNLKFGRDSLSTGWLLDLIWQTARELNCGAQFIGRNEDVGGDDHLPFLAAGIDAVDIIQVNSYPYWHTPEDTLDKISARSLKLVGDVVLASLPRIERHLLKQHAAE